MIFVDFSILLFFDDDTLVIDLNARLAMMLMPWTVINVSWSFSLILILYAVIPFNCTYGVVHQFVNFVFFIITIPCGDFLCKLRYVVCVTWSWSFMWYIRNGGVIFIYLWVINDLGLVLNIIIWWYCHFSWGFYLVRSGLDFVFGLLSL